MNKHLKRILPWLLLGPVSGLLAEGVFRSWRANRRSLACLYAAALALTTLDLILFSERIASASLL